MVKKLLLITIATFLLSSCAFFGASMFSMATSEEIYWIINSGDIRDFYILDNGDAESEPLLILVVQDGPVKVLIFDTALNIRGYMEDGVDGVSTDGVGFVDHNGDYVIGQTKIGRNGSTEPEDISFVPVPGMGMNSWISSYVHTDDVKYYLKVDNTGNLEAYNESWAWFDGQLIGNYNHIVINQKEMNFSSAVFAEQSGNLFVYTKEEIFNFADNISVLDFSTETPTFSITDTELTQWVTRCSKGYFVSNYDAYFLYDESGVLTETINYRDGNKEITTIDYECDFYYILDRNKGIIRKERVPF